MIKSDKRKDYWDRSYTEYWTKRVEEAGSGKSNIIQGDIKTEGDDFYYALFNQVEINNGSILDVGCAWGRMFPVYLKRKLKVYGADISSSMITKANENWVRIVCFQLKNNKSLVDATLGNNPSSGLPS